MKTFVIQLIYEEKKSEKMQCPTCIKKKSQLI